MFPSEGDGDIVEFEELPKQMRVPFVIYCDFEAFARKLDTCLPDPMLNKTSPRYEFCSYVCLHIPGRSRRLRIQ
jgi:hypothetical protein